MASVIDVTGIQFRRLNASKGPAVRSTRAQADKRRYRDEMRMRLEKQPASRCARAKSRSSSSSPTTSDGLVDAARIVGVTTTMGITYRARAVILTTGTFLRGAIFVGEAQGRGRSGRRGAVDRPLALARRARVSARASEDRHAVPHRPQDDRRRGPRAPARRRSAAAVSLGRRRHAAAAAAVVLDHVHEREHARDHPRRPAALAALSQRDRGHRAALLPEHRRQDRPVCGQRPPPDLSRARRHRLAPRSIRTASRRACRTTSSSRSSARFPASSAPR